MPDYYLAFSVERNRDEVNVVDSFVVWAKEQPSGVLQYRPDTWHYSPNVGFSRISDDDGIALTTFGFDIHRLHKTLVDFFQFAASCKGYAAVSSTESGAPVGAILVSNDPAVVQDTPRGKKCHLIRRYQAEAVLSDPSVFISTHDSAFACPSESK